MNFWKRLKKPIKVLAPMEDVTDTVSRQIIAGCGAPDVFFTEFTSVDGLFSKGRESVIKRLKFTKIEKPIVAQVWGKKPENYYKAGRILKELGFDGIDINMGCPIKNVVKNGCCSALIKTPKLAKEIILACMEGACDLPVSIKTRIGFNKVVTQEWCGFLLEFDPAALIVHGRTTKQMSKVPADWNEIEKVVKLRDKMESKTLIIGNGDVISFEDLNEKYRKHNVDGVMVGRGIFRDLFIFNPNKSLSELSSKQKIQLLLEHTKMFVKTWGEERNFAVMKKFFKIYCNGFDGAVELRSNLMKCKTFEDVSSLLRKERKFK